MDDGVSEERDYLLGSWLQFSQAIEEQPDLRRMLFDPVTNLPTTPLLFPRIRSLMEERNEVSLLCLNVVRYSKIEEIYGWKVFDDVMRETARALELIAGNDMRDSDIVAELMISGNAFVIVLSPPRESLHMDPDALQRLAERVESRVREVLQEKLDPSLFRKFGCYAGAATARFDSQSRLERVVHEALDRALAQSNDREALDAAARIERLKVIIAAEEVHTYVHPVLRLRDNAVVGYEALSRGPEGGEFERPDKLFAVAYDADLVLTLERLCRKRALEVARELPEGRLLFLNIEPEAVADPELQDAMFTTLLAERGLSPERIVLELTERAAINDFRSFRATLQYLRAMGFRVAVDDAGAGYGSLQCLAEVHPEWLKIDISLVRGIDQDDMRRELVGALVRFADRMGVSLVAEGIETPAELATVREIGVEYGQGFLFTRPVPPFPADADIQPSA